MITMRNHLLESKLLVFDMEANGLREEATKIWCICTGVNSSSGVSAFGPSNLDDSLNELSSADVLIGHNIIGYDLPVIKRLLGWEPSPNQDIFDTLVISRLLNPDREIPYRLSPKVGTHSVEAWALRLGCEQKVQHEDWSQYSEEMLERCKSDVRIQQKIYNAIIKEME